MDSVVKEIAVSQIPENRKINCHLCVTFLQWNYSIEATGIESLAGSLQMITEWKLSLLSLTLHSHQSAPMPAIQTRIKKVYTRKLEGVFPTCVGLLSMFISAWLCKVTGSSSWNSKPTNEMTANIQQTHITDKYQERNEDEGEDDRTKMENRNENEMNVKTNLRKLKLNWN